MAVIGISPCSKMADYESSLERAGATWQTIDYSRPAAEILAEIDGLLLTGGADVDPALYGETPHETYHAAEPGRDEHEIALVRAAVEAGRPVLAICRGIQVLNVAFGGSLVQDIPSMLDTTIAHSVDMPPNAIAHEVWINKDTALWSMLEEALDGEDACQANSRHHQAVQTVAPGFVVSATAPDGVVEAIERPGGTLCVGVQWHPENFWRTGEFRPLFEAFVRACEQQK